MIYANYWATTHYEQELNHDRFSRFYTKLLLFIPVGWWLSRQRYSSYLLAGCFVLGVIMTILINGLPSMPIKISLSSRLGLGFTNAQHGAMYGGSLLLISLCLIPKVFSISKVNLRFLAVVGIFFLTAFSLWIIIVTKSRGIWLGLAVVIPPGLFFLFRGLAYFKRHSTWKAIIASLLASTLLLIAVSQVGFVKSRMLAELDTRQLLLQGEFSKLPMSSIGIRVAQWSFAVDLIKERPLLGYGGDTKKWLIAQSPMPKKAKANFGHFHNSYLELAVAYGVLALGLFIAIITLLMYRSFKCLSASGGTHPFVYLGVLWPLFFAIANIFESYVMYRTGYALLAIVGGIIYGVTYRHIVNKAVD